MAENYQKLVNKQFNSPINLYSERNVREIIDKQSRILSNGAIGIDFNDPMVGKPANLQNSAVLRMLEEEENRKRGGQAGSVENNSKPLRDQIKWPPPPNDRRHRTYKDVIETGAKRVAWPPPAENDFVEQPPVQSQGGPIYPSKSAQSNQTPTQRPSSSPNYQQAPQSPNFQPITVDQPTSPIYQSVPISPGSSKSPGDFGASVKPWGPVQSPSFNQLQFRSVQAPQTVTKQSVHSTKSSVQEYQITQKYQSPSYSVSESSFQQYHKVDSQPQQPPQSQAAPSPQATIQQITRQTSYEATPQSPQQVTRQTSYQSTPQPSQATPQSPLPQSTPVQQPASPQIQSASPQQFKSYAQPTQSQPTSTPAKPQAQPYRSVQLKPAPPPSTITLRPQAPVSQAPPPVITSQPATATLRGGKNLRGDLKWPPEDVKEKMEAERRYLLELEKGPQFRPTKHLKDYSKFFAQHALNSTYPGYKIPPGTQFYDHNPVM